MYEIAPVSYGVLILIGAVNLITIAFAPEIVYIFAPAGYGGAVRCIPPIAMSAYFMFCYVLFSKISFYYGDTGQIAAATAAAAVLNLILNYLFIPVFGYTAAAYTTLLCFMLYAVFHYIVMRRVCRRELKGEYPFDTIRLLQITLAFMGTGFLYLSLYGHILLRYCLTLALMVILFSNRKKLAGYIREISAQHDR